MVESRGALPQAAPASSGTSRLTLLCLCALVAGAIGGVTASGTSFPGAAALEGTAEVLVRAWTNAFRLLVAPLVMSQLYLALTSGRPTARQAGRLGAVVAAVFLGLLLLTAAVATPLVWGLVRLPLFDGISLGNAAATSATGPAATGGAAWVDGIVPANLVAAATTDNILPLMLFMVAFALAMRSADVAAQATLTRFSQAVSHACFTMVGWLLRVTPVMILALAYRAALQAGLDVGAAVLAAAAVEILVVLLVLALLYPVTALLAGIPTGLLSRALWPAQLAALTTSSSLASLPALFQAAEIRLRLRADTAAYVLPLAGATLKLSRAVTGPVRLLFLARVLGIPIGIEQLVVFTATIILLSAAVVGVPSVSAGNRSLPAYVAVGIPAEYVVLLGVAVNFTDMFLTVFNTTGYLSATAIVDRLRGREPAEAGPAAARAPLLASAPVAADSRDGHVVVDVPGTALTGGARVRPRHK